MPQDFSDLAADVIDARRCTVEMPAGTGKTQLLVMVADLLVKRGGMVLVLTHTNAGVAAIKQRCSKLEVPSQGVRVMTVTSWTEMVVTSYPKASAMQGRLRGWKDNEYFNNVVRGATTLLEQEWFRRVVAASYQAVLVDEYQDCSLLQHRLVVALGDTLGSVTCFGDPLQRIFDFSGEQFPRWNDVVKTFPLFKGVVPYPHRWVKGNFELGEWLTYDLRNNIASSIASGNTFTLAAETFPSNMKVFGGTESPQDQINRAYRLANLQGDSLIICPNQPPKAAERFAKCVGKRYRYPEEVEAKFIRANVEKYIVAKNGGNLGEWLVSLIKECTCGASSALDKTVCRALYEGRPIDKYLAAQNRRSYEGLLTAIYMFVQAPGMDSLRDVDAALKVSPSTTFRLEAWRGTLRTIVEYERTGTDPEEILRTVREKLRFGGGRFSGNIVSRTLLVKGLEFPNVMVINANTGYTNENLYVALTRACNQLWIS